MTRFRALCVLAAILGAAALWAQPAFTPVIDGIQDGPWGGTPTHATFTTMEPTNFTLDGGIYVTNDLANLYIGIPTDLDPWGDGLPISLCVLIDVGGTAGGATTDPYGAAGVTYDQLYLPNYAIIAEWSESNQSIGWTNFVAESGGSWASYNEIASPAVGGAKGGGGGYFTEFAVPRSVIGNPADGSLIYLSAYHRPANNKNCATSCSPEDASFPGDWGDNCNGAFTSQFAYTIQVFSGDFDPPGISLVRQIDRGSVEIIFDEAMNIATSGVQGNYTPTGWVMTGNRWINASSAAWWSSGFTDGNSYTILAGQAITDLAGNPMDPNDDEVTWVAPNYTNVRFEVTDQTSTHNGLKFKGSWSLYREYDTGWNGGATYLLYDNGTNGDQIAGDHVWSRAWYLVPSVLDSFQWGITNENDVWILPPFTNLLFHLSGSDADTVVTYTLNVPDVPELNQDVTVTFRCDMQFITDPIDEVRIAGEFNGWSGQPMTDPDLDGVWTLDRLFTAGSAMTYQFKFQRIHNGTNWENVGNRVVTIDDSSPTYDAGNMFYDNYLAAPYNVTAYPVGNDVEVRWNDDYERVNFEVYTHSSPDSVILNGTLLGTTATNNLLDTDLGPGKEFYQVRTVTP